MANIEEIQLQVTNLQKSINQLKKAEGAAGGVGKTGAKQAKKFSAAITVAAGLAATALAAFYKKSIDAASNLEEQQNQFNVVFKGSIPVATAFRDELTSAYNLSELAATSYLNSIQDTLVPMGIQRETATELSGEMVKLAADLGSFKNIPVDRVLNAFTSAAVGNYEAMKPLGVAINDASIKQTILAATGKEASKTLSAQEKVYGVMLATLQSTTDAQGDVARSQDSYAFAARQLQKVIQDLQTTLGAQLLPALTKVLNLFSKGLEIFLKFPEPIQKFVGILGGLATAILAAAVAMAVFNVSLGPILPILIGVAAAIAGLVVVGNLVKDNWDMIGIFLEGIFTNIKFAFAFAVAKMRDGIAKFVIFALKAFQKFSLKAATALDTIIEGINRLTGKNIPTLSGLFDDLEGVIEDFGDAGANSAEKIKEEWGKANDEIDNRKDKIKEQGAQEKKTQDEVADKYKATQDKIRKELEKTAEAKKKANEEDGDDGDGDDGGGDDDIDVFGNAWDKLLDIQAHKQAVMETSYSATMSNLKNVTKTAFDEIGKIFTDSEQTAAQAAKNIGLAFIAAVGATLEALAIEAFVRALMSGASALFFLATGSPLKAAAAGSAAAEFGVTAAAAGAGAVAARAIQPEVPAFAKGGLVDTPTLGLIGERGRELVIPNEVTEILLSAAGSGKSGNGITINSVNITTDNPEVFADKMSEYQKRYGGFTR